MPYNIYPYELPPLPYPYDSMEPYIDTETMHYHHDKHFQTYVNNLNKALTPYPRLQKLTLTELLKWPGMLPCQAYLDIMNNAGGVYNHTFFFDQLTPAANTAGHEPAGRLRAMIDEAYTSLDNFKTVFYQQALSVFGSGWTCLVLTPQRRLKIVNVANQETVVSQNMTLLLLFDVWEHAYYLKYKNARADFVNALWNVVSFPEI